MGRGGDGSKIGLTEETSRFAQRTGAAEELSVCGGSTGLSGLRRRGRCCRLASWGMEEPTASALRRRIGGVARDISRRCGYDRAASPRPKHAQNARGQERLENTPTWRGSSCFLGFSPTKTCLPNSPLEVSRVFVPVGKIHNKTLQNPCSKRGFRTFIVFEFFSLPWTLLLYECMRLCVQRFGVELLCVVVSLWCDKQIKLF